ncbi:MAG: motility associated factor glycosyltransferase family protein [Treponema sp.]|nr:motility associated factor glycosyltransferase family protein [Treponema sp.]
MTSRYARVIQAKNGSPVPLFTSGRAAHSQYDPEREAARTAKTFPPEALFFVIAGFGAGYLAAALLEKNSACHIIAVEETDADISFVRTIPTVPALTENPRLTVVPLDRLVTAITDIYLPAVYGSLHVSELQNWSLESPDCALRFKSLVRDALALVTADYSVQAHFGALWQRNIIANLKHAAHTPRTHYRHRIPLEKTAYIAGAGPSLDENIPLLKKQRNDYFIIATDTAYRALREHGIHSDAVVTIDAQLISRMHFLCADTAPPLLVCDVGAVSTTARRYEHTVFITTGHPLATYAAQTQSPGTGTPFFPLAPGTGTVLTAAVDCARRMGFQSLFITGADFSYPRGTPYARGTYLDALYYGEQTRCAPAECRFSALLFRAPLIPGPSASAPTTAVLQSYRDSFIAWCAQSDFSVVPKNTGWLCTARHAASPLPFEEQPFDFARFLRCLKNDIAADQYTPGTLTAIQYAVLPYIAWLRTRISPAQKHAEFPTLLHLAYKALLRYTES